jgi:ERCC4-type nuclease
MPPKLVIDNREHALAAELTKLTVPFETAVLDVGDIAILTADGTQLLVAERKSHADFAASNTDGRDREQRARLMAVRGSGVAVLYILEGMWTADETRTWGRMTESNLKRLTTRLLLRYNMPVLASASVTDTARWCRTLLAQITDDVAVFQPEGDLATASAAAMSTFTAALSTAKKGNRTSGTVAAACLSGIPGLGAKRIEALLAVSSIAGLSGQTAAELSALVVGGKRLGAGVGAAIYEALHYHVAPVSET